MFSKEKLEQFFINDIFAMDMGIKIDDVSEDGATCSFEIEKKHLNAGEVVQGGAIFTLADFTFAVAANATGKHIVSRSADITFLKPGTGKKLIATAKKISSGGKTCLYTVEVCNDEGKTVAYTTVNGFVVGELNL